MSRDAPGGGCFRGSSSLARNFGHDVSREDGQVLSFVYHDGNLYHSSYSRRWLALQPFSHLVRLLRPRRRGGNADSGNI